MRTSQVLDTSSTDAASKPPQQLRYVDLAPLKEPVRMQWMHGWALQDLSQEFRVPSVEKITRDHADYEALMWRGRLPANIRFALFESLAPVTGFTILDQIEQRGWNNSTASVLLHFARVFKPDQVGRARIMCVGSRFYESYMYLEPKWDRWCIRFGKVDAFRERPNSLFLAWADADAVNRLDLHDT